MEKRKREAGSARQATDGASHLPRSQKRDRNATARPGATDKRYRDLFDRLPVGLYRTTPAGQIVEVNPAFLEMLGYPDLDTIRAIHAGRLYADPDDRARLMAILERDGIVIDFESRLRRRDGTFLWVRANARAVRDASGKVESFEGAIIDITERKLAQEALQESEERLRLVAQATNDLVWDWDLQTNEGWRGAGAEALFGYTGDLTRPWPEWWHENIHPEDREKVLSSVRAAITGGGHTWACEYRFRRADGEYAYVSDRAYILRDAHRPVRVVGAMADLSDRKDAEEEIKRRTVYLQALNAIIAGATSAAELRALLEETVDQTMKALDVRMGAIWVGDLHVDRGLPPEAGLIFALAREKAGPDVRGAVITNDWRDAPGPLSDIMAPLQTRFGIWASLSAPLENDGRIVGGIAVASPQFRTWLPEEATLVAAVGKQVGAAVKRLQMFHEAQRRAALMAHLVAFCDALSRSLTVADVIPAIGEGALKLGGADRGAVYLSLETGALTCPWSRNLSSRYIAEFLARYADLPTGELLRGGAELNRLTLLGGRVVEGKKPFLIPDVLSLPPESLTYALARPEGFRGVGAWPLVHEGRVIGLVGCYYDAPRTWSETEMEVFLAFCLQAAVALQNARLHDIQAQRTTDLEAVYARMLNMLPAADSGNP